MYKLFKYIYYVFFNKFNKLKLTLGNLKISLSKTISKIVAKNIYKKLLFYYSSKQILHKCLIIKKNNDGLKNKFYACNVFNN